ncbi:MAG TPA: hypothetical protein VGO93_22955 [Candidatus Xenobia bacterium]|jgi:hypothetical protein
MTRPGNGLHGPDPDPDEYEDDADDAIRARSRWLRSQGVDPLDETLKELRRRQQKADLDARFEGLGRERDALLAMDDVDPMDAARMAEDLGRRRTALGDEYERWLQEGRDHAE